MLIVIMGKTDTSPGSWHHSRTRGKVTHVSPGRATGLFLLRHVQNARLVLSSQGWFRVEEGSGTGHDLQGNLAGKARNMLFTKELCSGDTKDQEPMKGMALELGTKVWSMSGPKERWEKADIPISASRPPGLRKKLLRRNRKWIREIIHPSIHLCVHLTASIEQYCRQNNNPPKMSASYPRTCEPCYLMWQRRLSSVIGLRTLKMQRLCWTLQQGSSYMQKEVRGSETSEEVSCCFCMEGL